MGGYGREKGASARYLEPSPREDEKAKQSVGLFNALYRDAIVAGDTGQGVSPTYGMRIAYAACTACVAHDACTGSGAGAGCPATPGRDRQSLTNLDAIGIPDAVGLHDLGHAHTVLRSDAAEGLAAANHMHRPLANRSGQGRQGVQKKQHSSEEKCSESY